MRHSEHEIQVKVVQHIRAFHPECLIFAIPNGSATTPKNRLHLHKEGMMSGVPDLFVAEAKNGFNGLFVEMKTPEGIESPEQKKVRIQLNSKNYLVYVARSSDTAIELIENYLN